MSVIEEFKTYLEYVPQKEDFNEDEIKLIWFAEEIIDFTGYDDNLSLKIGRQLYEIAKAIINRTQQEYMKENYEIYIVCLNLIGLNNLNWGTSIRYCWFEDTEKAKLIQEAVKFIEGNK